MELTVVDNRDGSQFEARTEDGTVAGYVEYRRHEDRVTLVHTEVNDGFQGKGVGSRLARGTFAALQSETIRVRNACPFLQRFIDRHPGEYDWVEAVEPRE